MADFIPGREAELVQFAADLVTNVAALTPAAIGLDTAQQTELADAVTAFTAAYEPASSSPHHIVASGSDNTNAAAARGVLQRQGIDINEASAVSSS